MKAVILAGGFATRLWPITRHRPKMLLPLGEQTVIDRIYASLEREARIDEVFVSTNERFAPDFEQHHAAMQFQKPKLSIEPTRAEAEKLGVIGALRALIDREDIEDDLLVIAGDNIFDFDMADFLDEFERRQTPTIAVYDVEDLERARPYGALELADDRVTGFEEKPSKPRSSCVSVGCYAFPSESLGLIGSYIEAGNDPDEIGWLIQWLYTREPTYAFTYEGTWFDVGTVESDLNAVAWTLDGSALIDDTATLTDVSIGPNVHIMSHTSLADVDVEHAVIFPDVRLTDVHVRHSVIDEGAALGGLTLHNAMVGGYTVIRDGHRPDSGVSSE